MECRQHGIERRKNNSRGKRSPIVVTDAILSSNSAPSMQMHPHLQVGRHITYENRHHAETDRVKRIRVELFSADNASSVDRSRLARRFAGNTPPQSIRRAVSLLLTRQFPTVTRSTTIASFILEWKRDHGCISNDLTRWFQPFQYQ